MASDMHGLPFHKPVYNRNSTVRNPMLSAATLGDEEQFQSAISSVRTFPALFNSSSINLSFPHFLYTSIHAQYSKSSFIRQLIYRKGRSRLD
jgi:hypothetical protein